MVETTSNVKSQIATKLEEIVSNFYREVFSSHKRIPVALSEEEKSKEFEVFYKDGKIYINSESIDLNKILEERIKKYKSSYTDAFIDLLGHMYNITSKVIAAGIYAHLNVDPKEYEKNKIVYDSLEKVIRNIYEDIGKEVKYKKLREISKDGNIPKEKSFEEIVTYITNYITEINNFVINELKNKENHTYLDIKFGKEAKEAYQKIAEISEKLPYLTLINILSVSKIFEDLSSGKIPVEKYKEIIEPVEKYKEIIETGYKKLKEEPKLAWWWHVF